MDLPAPNSILINKPLYNIMHGAYHFIVMDVKRKMTDVSCIYAGRIITCRTRRLFLSGKISLNSTAQRKSQQEVPIQQINFVVISEKKMYGNAGFWTFCPLVNRPALSWHPIEFSSVSLLSGNQRRREMGTPSKSQCSCVEKFLGDSQLGSLQSRTLFKKSVVQINPKLKLPIFLCRPDQEISFGISGRLRTASRGN